MKQPRLAFLSNLRNLISTPLLLVEGHVFRSETDYFWQAHEVQVRNQVLRVIGVFSCYLCSFAGSDFALVLSIGKVAL